MPGRYRSKVELQAFLAPAVYAGLNLLEAQIVTPNVLGGRLTLNSVIAFLSVGFWGWIWGLLGASLAVPLLVILKALCDHIERLSALGEFLSDRSAPEPQSLQAAWPDEPILTARGSG